MTATALSNALPDTASARLRHWLWTPALPGEPMDGRLQVFETAGVKSPRTVVRTYAAEEQPAGRYPGRVFLVVKLAHANDRGAAGAAGESREGDVYEVRVSAQRGVKSSCSCPAGCGGKRCLHAEAFTDAVALGLPDPRESGCDRVPEARESARDEQLDRAAAAVDKAEAEFVF